MMPTYEYECQRCGHVFERFQSMKDEPLKRCPECRGKVKRLIGAGAGIIFKGSGFYETDYRSEEYRRKAKAEKNSSTGTESKSDGKSGSDSKSKKDKKSKSEKVA
jgi:putative FmdB family regulatory protein